MPPLLDVVPTADALTTPRTTSAVDTAPTATTSESSQRVDADTSNTDTSNTDTSNTDTSNVDTSVVTDEVTLHDAPPPPKRAMQLAPPTTAPVRTYSEQELAQALSVEMESQSAREIQVDVAIQGITVSDESVCRALASDGRVFLVGGQLGETVVEVKPVDGSPSRLLKVKVIAPWQSSHGVADLDQLLHAIRPLSPNGNLTIRAQNDGSLLVQGKVDNKETARRVMELTRKLILVPIVDKLEIR
jgi:Flp pilus assembly secretin CpaC